MAEIEKAQVTLEKLIKNCDDTKVKIAELTKEIKLLKKQHEKLYQEELQNDIAKAWFKEEKLTNEQIYKFLEISKQISDKIDGLETKAVVSAVNDVYNQAQQAQQSNEAENKKEDTDGLTGDKESNDQKLIKDEPKEDEPNNISDVTERNAV